MVAGTPPSCRRACVRVALRQEVRKYACRSPGRRQNASDSGYFAKPPTTPESAICALFGAQPTTVRQRKHFPSRH